MPRNRITTLFLLSLLIGPLASACDKSEPAADANKEPEKTEDEKKLEARLAAKRAEREAEAKAAEDKANAIKALAALPAEMPKDLEAACKAVAQAQDEFMKKHYDGEGLKRWEEAKGTQMGMLEGDCKKKGSVEVAACQTNAMNSAPSEFKKDLPDLLAACIEKFGGGAAQPG